MGNWFESEISSVDDFIKVPKFNYTLLGLWPIKKSKWSWLYHLYALLVPYLISFIFLITLTIDLYLSLGDLEELADASYYFMTQLTYVLKFMLLTFKNQEFRAILKYLEDPVFHSHLPEQQKFIDKWSKFATNYCIVFYACCYLCAIFYAIFPFIDSNEENILPLRGWFPFDVKTNLTNRICVYIFQIVGLIITIIVNVCLDVFPTIFMNIACAQLEVLKDNLENAIIRAESSGENNENIQENNIIHYKPLTPEQDEIVHNTLCKCIQHHEAIVKLVANAEKIFTYGMLVLFVVTAITMTITGLQLIVVPINSLKFFAVGSYLSAVIFEISCYCWNGHHVIVQSSSIGESCYHMSWYRCSIRVKKTIFIIMERTKRPITMTAGNFFTLSIETLTAILRSAYSYFAVLHQVYNKD